MNFAGAVEILNGIGSILKGISANSASNLSSAAPQRHLSLAHTMQQQIHNVSTIDERVGYIKGLVRRAYIHPDVQRLAVNVVSQKCGKEWCTKEKDANAEIAAIHKAVGDDTVVGGLFAYVRENMRYVRDPVGVDVFRHPLRSLSQFGGGDCDDYVVVLSSLLMAIGYPVVVRVVQTKDASDWSHVYILVGTPAGSPRKWTALDASEDVKPGWQPPKDMIKRHRDFPLFN